MRSWRRLFSSLQGWLLSTVAAGYISLGSLTPKQTEFFFKGGAIFQLMDDLGDIVEDSEDGVATVWTLAQPEKIELAKVMDRFLKLEGAFESELPALAAEFQESKWVERLYRFGFTATLIRSVLNQPAGLGGRLGNLVSPFLPVPFWYLRRNVAALKDAFESRETSQEDLPLKKLALSFLGN